MRTFEDRSLSIVLLAIAATLGWKVLNPPRRDLSVPAATRPHQVLQALNDRVAAIAEAIAAAEGYYAPGTHDGHSLPYRLNNPGSLKKSAAGLPDLPTWQDTGLLMFPTADAGWSALRQQVCAMLTGRSRIYRPSDTLIGVGEKYADGDPNWGVNVATRLGVSPDISLADLVADVVAGGSPVTVCSRPVL